MSKEILNFIKASGPSRMGKVGYAASNWYVLAALDGTILFGDSRFVRALWNLEYRTRVFCRKAKSGDPIIDEIEVVISETAYIADEKSFRHAARLRPEIEAVGMTVSLASRLLNVVPSTPSQIYMPIKVGQGIEMEYVATFPLPGEPQLRYNVFPLPEMPRVAWRVRRNNGKNSSLV